MRFITSTNAVMALRMWGLRQWYTALFGTAASIVVLGVPTVLIPNSLFVREIPPTMWSYPVWIVTSILMGLLVGGALAWFAKGQVACPAPPREIGAESSRRSDEMAR